MLALYVTGLGAVAGYDTALVSQVPRALPERVLVTVGDRSAQVAFAGVVGPGLYQVNFAVPSGVTGDAPVTVQIGDIRSPNITGSRIVVAQ